MKKKILSTLLAATLAMSSLPMALAADGDVEIGFKVGDSTLMINGQAQTVETPYVVGEGVTLVPLRVITEAFGAEVIWEGETKSITLKYPDVEILLQIDNPTAEVNGTAQTLLSAPELTPNGVTMVPLRFISETFGAEVSYDEATGGIKVIKKKVVIEQNSALDVIDNAYIGDNYYGWSMENLKDAVSMDRTFDGMSTIFKVDDETGLSVLISLRGEDFDFESTYQKMKQLSQGATLTRENKNTNSQTGVIQFKDTKKFTDIRLHVTDKYVYLLTGHAPTANTDMTKKISSVLDTFNAKYITADIRNLSEVENGMRKYESEMFEYSVLVPADFYKSSASSDSEMKFRSNNITDHSSMDIRIWSKEDGQTAQTAADEALASNKALLNNDIVRFGKIEQVNYGTNTFTAYTYEVDGAYSGDKKCIDAFVEKGNYIYEINININASRPDNTVAISNIMSSLDIPTLDFDTTGSILINKPETTGTYTEERTHFSVAIPMRYQKAAQSSSGNSLAATNDSDDTLYLASDIDASIIISEIHASNITNVTLLGTLEKWRECDKEDWIKRPSNQTLGKENFATMLEYIRDEESHTAFYRKTYMIKGYRAVVAIIAEVDEMYYSKELIEEFDSIAASYHYED